MSQLAKVKARSVLRVLAGRAVSLAALLGLFWLAGVPARSLCLYWTADLLLVLMEWFLPLQLSSRDVLPSRMKGKKIRFP